MIWYDMIWYDNVYINITLHGQNMLYEFWSSHNGNSWDVHPRAISALFPGSHKLWSELGETNNNALRHPWLSWDWIFNWVWLVVWTPLENISQLGWLFPIYGKIQKMATKPPTRNWWCCFWPATSWDERLWRHLALRTWEGIVWLTHRTPTDIPYHHHISNSSAEQWILRISRVFQHLLHIWFCISSHASKPDWKWHFVNTPLG